MRKELVAKLVEIEIHQNGVQIEVFFSTVPNLCDCFLGFLLFITRTPLCMVLDILYCLPILLHFSSILAISVLHLAISFCAHCPGVSIMGSSRWTYSLARFGS